ncbi:MAG: hypothetical protein CMQ40_00670 [Gammaproteobacteria bacterium]|nr:hypothetical protein [Gammaproteobacteria bacterium]|tara:strand:- start:335 stop:1210 length:876 start_codon:yes stop_codon:yes gene_type:complete
MESFIFGTFNPTLRKLIHGSMIFGLASFSVSAEWITLQELNPDDQLVSKNWVTLKPTISANNKSEQQEQIPDFSSYRDVKEKKEQFFKFMLPMVRTANQNIRNERRLLTTIEDRLQSGLVATSEELLYLEQLGDRYRVQNKSEISGLLNELLLRVDEVPASLVLAQSATESGWGTSRFAIEANNMFGVWCFREGCGIKPLKRDKERTYEVAKYDSVQESVEAYIHTINSHRAYEPLRRIREKSRKNKSSPSGITLADGLLSYSEKGEEYVRQIKQLIKFNKLSRYNSKNNA